MNELGFCSLSKIYKMVYKKLFLSHDNQKVTQEVDLAIVSE